MAIVDFQILLDFSSSANVNRLPITYIHSSDSTQIIYIVNGVWCRKCHGIADLNFSHKIHCFYHTGTLHMVLNIIILLRRICGNYLRRYAVHVYCVSEAIIRARDMIPPSFRYVVSIEYRTHPKDTTFPVAVQNSVPIWSNCLNTDKPILAHQICAKSDEEWLISFSRQ